MFDAALGKSHSHNHSGYTEWLSYTKFKDGTPLQVHSYWSEEWAPWGTMLCNRNGWQIRDAEWNATDEEMEKAHASMVENVQNELCDHCDGAAFRAAGRKIDLDAVRKNDCICVATSDMTAADIKQKIKITLK